MNRSQDVDTAGLSANRVFAEQEARIAEGAPPELAQLLEEHVDLLQKADNGTLTPGEQERMITVNDEILRWLTRNCE